jgi:hypothetical protein
VGVAMANRVVPQQGGRMHPVIVFFTLIILFLCSYTILARRTARKYWLIFGDHISFNDFYEKYARWSVWRRASNHRIMSRLFGVHDNLAGMISHP